MNKRFILTLISRRDDDSQLAQVSSLVSSMGFSIGAVSQPSDKPDLICHQLSVAGSDNDLNELNQNLKHLADELSIDLVFQEDTENRCNKKLAVF